MFGSNIHWTEVGHGFQPETRWIPQDLERAIPRLQRFGFFRFHVEFCDPRCSMYGLFTYIWVVLGVNVGKYTIH